MKIVDCVWELRNLGVNTVEVTVERGDKYDEKVFIQLEDKYGYKVVKVPENMVVFNMGLSSLGYSFIETQIDISMKVKDFNYDDKWIKRLEPYCSFRDIETEDSFEETLQRINSEMFVTDRVALDPTFGFLMGCERYKNWITSEYYKGTSKLQQTLFKNEVVGFGMYRIEGKTMHGTLGGLYSDIKVPIGVLVPSCRLIQIKKEGLDVDLFTTSISSNNKPIWQLYNYFNFKVDGIKYVFIKH